MRVFRMTAALILASIFSLILAGCSRTIRSPADELCMNRWGTVTENGNRIDLAFDDDTAAFRAENDAFSLSISGVYSVDDTTLMINDSTTHLDYSFFYVLYGDRIELTYGDATLLLSKK